MLYPKNKMHELIANLIGADIVRGRYWFIYREEPTITKYLNDLKLLMNNNKTSLQNVLEIKNIFNKELVIINPEIVQEVANELLEKIYITNPLFPRLHSSLDFNKIRQKEINNLVDYINSRESTSIDIYLFKSNGLRTNTQLIYDNKNNIYQKTMFGFYLIDKDIKDVNKALMRQKHKKKIINVQQQECLNRDFGIRYTLNIENLS